ncbi:hypothetical protein A9Q87_08185 [Flavobacteriales bacterium 34_180_T64]|nr:hypothetical protein A9Q87_08185 [Flavobacteriales bacterium 34_180_T64]
MKTLVTTLVVLFITTLSFSQDSKYGVRGGITISNLDYKDVPINENKHRNGFVFGVYAEYGLTETLSVAPELQFSTEGSNHENFANDYLNLPVLLKYSLIDRISIGVGPQLGLKVHANDDGFKNLVFSGVGLVEINLFGDWSIDARYNYGFSNVFDDELLPEAKNAVWQFGLNYKI